MGLNISGYLEPLEKVIENLKNWKKRNFSWNGVFLKQISWNILIL
jgi:hypothetical protein